MACFLSLYRSVNNKKTNISQFEPEEEEPTGERASMSLQSESAAPSPHAGNTTQVVSAESIFHF